MFGRITRRYDFGGIPRDRWLSSIGRLSDSERSRLRLRSGVFAAYRIARAFAMFPVTLIASAVSLVWLMVEVERLHASPRRKMQRGTGCKIDVQTWLSNGQNIELGDFVKISAFSTVIAGQVATIKIGSNTIIGPSVTIVALNHGTAPSGVPIRYQEWVEKPIVIGSDVWIGASVVVLPGSTIESGSVIAAGAIVTGRVPAEHIAYMRGGILTFRKRQ